MSQEGILLNLIEIRQRAEGWWYKHVGRDSASPTYLVLESIFDFGFVSLSLCHFPVIQLEQARCFFEQFRKPAGCRISYRLSNLTNL